MRHKASIALAAAVLLTIAGVFIHSCGAGGGTVRRGITLDSGLDKKSAAGMADVTESASNEGYENQYRTATTMEQGMYATPPSGEESRPANAPAASAGAYSADLLGSIESWFNPVAYAQDADIDEKYLIRNGEITLDVKDFDAALSEVYAVAEQFGGLVTDSDIQDAGDNERSGWIIIRVPNTSFFKAMLKLDELGEATNQKISSEDVSRQYVAAVSRLRNLTIEQGTLQKMLDEALAVQRSRGLGEGYKILLDTQARLSEVTGQIQSIENEISQLADQITRSTIRVNLFQREQYEPEAFTWGMGATFEESKKELLSVVRGAGQWLIHFGVVGWLYLLPWVIVFWILFRVYRRYLLPKLLTEQKPVTSGGSGPAT